MQASSFSSRVCRRLELVVLLLCLCSASVALRASWRPCPATAASTAATSTATATRTRLFAGDVTVSLDGSRRAQGGTTRGGFWWGRGSSIPGLSDASVEQLYALSKCILPLNVQAEDLAALAGAPDAALSSLSPLLCFVNRDSGGRRGRALLAGLQSLGLNSLQICDLKAESPSARLQLFQGMSKSLNVLCCGGDGTINWILDELGSLNMTVGSFGIIPLGTGNDLYLQTFTNQRQERGLADEAHGGAAAYSYAVSAEQVCANPKSVLAHHAWNIQRRLPSTQTQLDRWTAEIRTTEVQQYIQQQRAATPSSTVINVVKRFFKVLTLTLGAKRRTAKNFSNYVGFGVDGAVSLSFSHLRNAAPFLFFSRLLNKVWYAVCGLYQVLFGQHRRDLSRVIHVTCDGAPVDVPSGIRGLVALNINSYAGGTKLWRADEPFQKGFGARLGKWNASSMSDGILEVMGVYGIRHLGLIKSGLASAVPICQGRHVKFNCTIQTPMQIDGEPFMQKPCVVELSLLEQVNVTVPIVTAA